MIAKSQALVCAHRCIDTDDRLIKFGINYV